MAAAKLLTPIEEIAEKRLLYDWPVLARSTLISQRTGGAQSKEHGAAMRPPIPCLIGIYAITWAIILA